MDGFVNILKRIGKRKKSEKKYDINYFIDYWKYIEYIKNIWNKFMG